MSEAPGRESFREAGPGVRVYADPAGVARAAAREFVETAQACIAARGIFQVALSGGNTPRALFRLLASEEFRSSVDWARAQLYWSDERCVPPENPDSNFGMARRVLLTRISIPAENVHPMPADRPDLESAAKDYEEILRKNLPVDAQGFPRFDLMFLGLGPDGHTASLFPGSDGVEETSRWVIAPLVQKFQAHRMTLTLPVLNAAFRVIFLVTGAEKIEALRGVVGGARRPPYPAQRVTVPNGERILLVDEAAAGGLG